MHHLRPRHMIITAMTAIIIATGSLAAAATPPAAEFQWYTNGLKVYFQDLSTGEIDTWLWEFGDGNASPRMNPVHTYESDGSYGVSLTVSNQHGESTRTLVILRHDDRQATGDPPQQRTLDLLGRQLRPPLTDLDGGPTRLDDQGPHRVGQQTLDLTLESLSLPPTAHE